MTSQRPLSFIVALSLCLTALARQSSAAEQPDPNALKCPPDWKVEVLAKAPDIQHPSVVTTSPDGRIFVGEDPVDMHLPSDAEADRILCISPDGKKTVFAEKLHAVYGIQYIDGKVFVHHPPFVSVFTDDGSGVAKDRVDIIKCTNPNPWATKGFNDHIPSNFRLAMDGYLYMSTGDKGIFNAVGTDGSKAELRGGGVLRLKPDGSNLEVYSRGTRNHLDVALNSEDELFSYDNTDDGLGWWTRYTHMVDGGYYGYPWDYRPVNPTGENIAKQIQDGTPGRPYTLWRMAEYGGGSPCGAVSYSEDALPAEYHDNNFHCEWGKGRVERFVVERAGGTYKVVKRDDTFLTPGGDLRPVGICVTHDGTGFIVTDWNFSGWKNESVGGKVGRLIRLTYTGKMNPTPRPSWYVAAGTGKPFNATTAELVAALKHPARSVRLVAQRRLVDRAKEAIELLRGLLKDANAPAAARWHAIWTLDAIDGGQAARADVIAIAADSKTDVSVRRQAVRQLGRTHDANVAAALVVALQDSDASLRFQAATALGRIGKVAAVAPLLEKLAHEDDFFTRYATFTALNRIGRADPAAWPAILEGLNGQTPQAKQYTTYALRETYDPALVKALGAYVCDAKRPADSRALAVTALAALHKHPKPWDGKWWNTQPAVTPPPAKVVAWDGTDAVASAIASALGDASTDVRAAAVGAATVAPDARQADALSKLFKDERDPKLRSDVLRALAAASPDAARGFAREVLGNPGANVETLPAVIEVAEKIGGAGLNEAMIEASTKPLPADSLALLLNSLGRLKNADVIPAISRHVSSKDVAVAIAALEALAHAGGERATQSILPALSDGRPEIRRAAVSALANNPSSAAIEPLIKAYADPATRRDAILALAKTPDVRALDAYLDGLGSPDATLRDPARNAIKEIAPQARPLIESKLDKVVLSTQAIDELQRLYSFYVPVENWKIIGPLPIESTETIDLANPSTSTSMTGIKGPAGWRKGKPQARGLIDLGKQFKYDGKGIAYAVAHIDAPAARDVELVTGSDDSMTLWLNGKQVMSDPNDSAWSPEEQRTKASLKAGDNVLVAKLGNRSGYWQFSVSISAERTGKLFEYDTRKLDPALYASFALDHKGNIESGKKIFFNANGVGCVKCHKATIGGEGGEVGPALAGVGGKYDRAKLIESILYPSRQIFDGYQQTLVRTKSGKTFAGSVRGETEADFTLIDANGVKTVVRKSDVDKRKVSQLSLMPEGLHAALKPEEFSDLVSYLESLKEAPAAK